MISKGKFNKQKLIFLDWNKKDKNWKIVLLVGWES